MTESIGRLLNRARNAKALSLTQVYKALRIKERYLLALEEDRLEDLPSPVQGKGFLRLYWEYLDLSLEDLETRLAPPPPAPDTGSAVPADAGAAALPPGVTTPGGGADQPEAPEPGTAGGNFQEIGSQLRGQRRRLSMTLEAVSAATHIPSHYLRALEEGRIEDLPSSVQARGLLQNYASYLDLDLEEVMLRFADGLQMKREALTALPDKKPRRRRFELPALSIKDQPLLGALRNVFSLDILLLLIVALAAFVTLIWGAASLISDQQAPQRTQAALAEQISLTRTAEGGLLPTEAQPEASTPVPAAGGESATATLTSPTGTGAPIQVFVVARQRSYLQVIADGQTVFTGRTTAGNPYYFEGRSQIELIGGNAAALQVVYNQVDLGTLGDQGAVVHLIFSQDRVGTPTLVPSFTPTVTQTPSRTPIPSNTYPPTRTRVPTSTPYPSNTPTP